MLVSTLNRKYFINFFGSLAYVEIECVKVYAHY